MPKLDARALEGVSETLVIPLAYRDDELAQRFRDTIDYDWARFDRASPQGASIVERTRILDVEVASFVHAHPDALIVNLGAGLDTRFHRLDNGSLEWIEVDLPAVIAFRAKLGEPANPRHTLFAGSVIDIAWIDEAKRHGARSILLVAEGLLPYFSEDDHRLIFGRLADHFAGHELLFHTMAPSIMRAFAGQSALGKLRTTVDMQWGLEHGRDIELLDPRVRYVREHSLLSGGQLPAAVQGKVSLEQLRDAAKIVHVRFQT